MSTTVTPSSAASSQSTDPTLIMTITGIDGATVVAAERMRDYARQLGLQAGLVLNVQTPQWRLRDDHAALEFVHESAGYGHELLLGGLGPLGGDAGKGEFHRLGRHESLLRLTAARRQLATLGIEPTVFAPSRWLASEASLSAAEQLGFTVAADAYTIRDLAAPSTHNVRVLAFGDGFGAVAWWRRNVRNSVHRIAERGQDIRLSISAHKAAKKDIRRDMEAILKDLASAGYRSASHRGFVERRHATAA